MLEWLSMFFRKLTAWCPQFHKVPPTHRIVKWQKCRKGTLHGPGIVWYWPLVTEVEVIDIRWKSLVTHVQTVTLADGVSVSARTLTRWKPSDALKCVTEEEDYEDTVGEAAQSVLVDVLSPCTYDMLKQSNALNVALSLAMQEELRVIGVQVKKCKFTELCSSPAFRLINDG
jgi:regulator of protease activity HflC (stomatin/prohibitin superfamily)